MPKAERSESDKTEAADAADAAEATRNEKSRKGRDRTARADVEITAALEHARWRHFGWSVFGLVVGGLFVVVLGVIGKFVGVVLLLVAALAALNFAKTLLHVPGTIRVGTDKLVVPAGLCRGADSEYDYDVVRHAFFLRRAVPWTRAGPVLVIEAGDAAYSYPRDWFASESDQRRVVEAINRRLGRE
jgi:hypothetical protein